MSGTKWKTEIIRDASQIDFGLTGRDSLNIELDESFARISLAISSGRKIRGGRKKKDKTRTSPCSHLRHFSCIPRARCLLADMQPRSTLIAQNHSFPGRPHHFGTHRGLSSDRRGEIAAKGFHDEKEILRENSPYAAAARLI